MGKIVKIVHFNANPFIATYGERIETVVKADEKTQEAFRTYETLTDGIVWGVTAHVTHISQTKQITSFFITGIEHPALFVAGRHLSSCTLILKTIHNTTQHIMRSATQPHSLVEAFTTLMENVNSVQILMTVGTQALHFLKHANVGETASLPLLFAVLQTWRHEFVNVTPYLVKTADNNVNALADEVLATNLTHLGAVMNYIEEMQPLINTISLKLFTPHNTPNLSKEMSDAITYHAQHLDALTQFALLKLDDLFTYFMTHPARTRWINEHLQRVAQEKDVNILVHWKTYITQQEPVSTFH
jgi:hypothetical protein